MNCVANVVFPAPDAPMTTVVERSLKPPSSSELSPKIPVRIFRTRAHREGLYKKVASMLSEGETQAAVAGGKTSSKNAAKSLAPIPRPSTPSFLAAKRPSRNNATVGTTATAYRSHNGLSSASSRTIAKRSPRASDALSKSGRNRRQCGHHSAQNATTIGPSARSTSRSNDSSSGTSSTVMHTTPLRNPM